MTNNDKYVSLTKNQRQAVLLDKGDALVSASAGSGKTHVLIERIIRLILERQTTVDRILAVTFTKLAAGEMKDKLKTALLKEIVNGNDDLKWQYDQVNTCDISTIDSFCSKIVKKYFYKLDIDYSFNVLDETQRKSFKNKAIDEVLSEHYENPDQNFLDLAFVLTSSKNDNLLRETLLSFITDSESKLDKNEFFALSINTHENALEVIDNDLTKYCNDYGLYFEDLFSSYRNLFEEESFIIYIDKLIEISVLLKNAKSVFDVINDITLPKSPSKPRNKYVDFFDTFKNVHLKCFSKFIEDIKEVLSCDKETISLQASTNLNYIKTLQSLVLECLDYYDKLKKDENSYDFSDIEKFAYTLLLDQEVLTSVKGEYDFIFIDEYQDVNGIQENIINLLAQDNEFMVGDSKQSIYAFRGCNPNYFISKYSAYEQTDDNLKNAISLDNNFRSSRKVIDSVNNVFSRVFTKNFGGFDYKNKPMIFNEKYQDYEGDCTLYLYGKNRAKEEIENNQSEVYSVIKDFNSQKDKKYSSQVLLIASLIRKAIGTKYYDIKEKDESKRFKSIDYKDICILFRNLNETNIKIIQDLNSLGVPVTAEAKIKLNTYPEIQAIIQLIKGINCLNDDVAISTIMSTIYTFTFDELATIRKSEGFISSFYDAVVSFSQKDGVLNNKVKSFLENFNKIRLLAEYQKADDILFKILDESGFETRLLTSPFGEFKLKRIKRLINESCKSKKLTIKEFGVYLDDAIDDVSTSETSGDNACKVMTIHASKGLEFPYVILASTSSKFNFADIEKVRIIKNEKYGITIKHHDKESMSIKETPLTFLAKKQSYLDATLEEARVLYVAMTRAMFKLDVLAKENTLNTNLPFFVKHPSSFSEFFKESDMDINLCDTITSVEYDEHTLVAGTFLKENSIKTLIDNFYYEYPYNDVTKMPVKVSVSEVSKVDDEYFETTNLFGTTNKEKGTAYHKILQLIDFYAPSIEEQINSLESRGLITAYELSLIEIDKIKSILKMDIFNKIKDYKLYKEEKFTFFISPNELGYNLKNDINDKVLIQGIIDLMAIKNDKCILIDYKLSSLKNDDDLIKTYKTQLTLYKNAIEDCLNLKVENVYLVNILQEKLVEIK